MTKDRESRETPKEGTALTKTKTWNDFYFNCTSVHHLGLFTIIT